ncbi:MAG: hypothetical protein P4M11_03000 [Candidatus Pacebacteria bacterium]|nr:hypothetical protein [Candidatus Paceibacterota bacterium]
MYSEEAKYLGYINLQEVHGAGQSQYPLDAKLKKVDFMFYHNTNIQALIILFNRQLLLLCNNFRYETALDFEIIDCLRKPVEYELDLPIIMLEQSSTGSVVLCTSSQGHLARKYVGEPGRKRQPLSVIRRLHAANGIAVCARMG